MPHDKKIQSKPEEPLPPPSAAPCAVAGFGASAGGFEAFKELLEHLPENPGAAFVFIQHLDPRHSSMLSQLLGRVTKMPVVQAADGMRLEADHIYVIPPNTGMTLS